MKTTLKQSLIRSVVALGSCLALAQATQAAPRFQGVLTIGINGGIMAMGMGMGSSLGSDTMVMLMGTTSVAVSAGDFAVMGIRRGDAVTLSSTMLMPGSTESALMVSSASDWMWMGMGPETFSSTGPNNLRVTTAGMTMGGGYPMTAATLTADFFTDQKGVIHGLLTLTAGSGENDDTQ